MTAMMHFSATPPRDAGSEMTDPLRCSDSSTVGEFLRRSLSYADPGLAALPPSKTPRKFQSPDHTTATWPRSDLV
jgi:hypothetical protein